MGISTEDLCAGLAPSFREFAEAAMALRFEDEPRYEAYQALFEPVLYGATSIEKPITIDPSLKVVFAPKAFLARMIDATVLTAYLCDSHA